MIDFHTHILPCMDDGSTSISESLEMLVSSYAQNVDIVCATPHFYRYKETVGRFLARRDAAHAALLPACAGTQIPELRLGAEVAFYYEMSKDEELRRLCIGESNCILIEMPFSPWTAGTLNEIYSITGNLALTPVIAHIERYPDFFTGNYKLSELHAMGAFLQINAESVLSRRTRKSAIALLDSGICLLGSDCHGLTERPPNMSRAFRILERALGTAQAETVLALGYKVLSAKADHD